MLHRLSIATRIRTIVVPLAHGPRARILRAATAIVAGISLSASAVAVPVLVRAESASTEPFSVQTPADSESVEPESTPRSSAVMRTPETANALSASGTTSRSRTQPARDLTGTGGRTALLIGIDSPRGSRPLEGAVTDVENVHTALLKYGFKSSDITMLIEEQATIDRIRAELASFARRSRPDGIAVFAWAGHSSRGRSGNTFATHNGERFSVRELASSLSKVRSRMWVVLPTCYSGGYSLPGITGPRRVAVFSSSADEQTWELGSAGTHVIIYMVRHAMVEGRADGSVEEAFEYARKTLQEERPDRVPAMNDQVKANLVLAVGSEAASDAGSSPPKENSKPDAEQQPGPKPKDEQPSSPTPRPEDEDDGDPSIFRRVVGS